MEAFIGQIVLFAGNFAPRGWALCEGQLLPVQQNQSLYAIIGPTYGGDGRATFALPDLRSAAPIGVGSSPGLPDTKLGGRGVINESSGNTPQMGTVGLNYIICLEGVFPPRH